MYDDLSSSQVDGTDLHGEGPSHSDSPSLELHAFWNMEPVYIQVNKTVFVVPRDAFQGFDSGSIFGGVGRSSPSATVEDTEGLTRTRPIVLKISNSRLTHGMCTCDSGLLDKQKLDILFDDWSGVLRLLTIWGHEASRKQAIDSMTKAIKTSDDVANMVRLGKEHSVAQWTRDAYIALIRNTSIELRELAEQPFEFDWETIAKIIQAKYEAVPKASVHKKPSRFCSDCDQPYFDPSGALQICLCRATATFEDYFPDLNDSNSSQTTASSTFAVAEDHIMLLPNYFA